MIIHIMWISLGIFVANQKEYLHLKQSIVYLLDRKLRKAAKYFQIEFYH